MVSGLLMVLYTVLVFVYIPVMLKIMLMLKRAYQDLYSESKYKLITWSVVYEVFLTFRVYSYAMY